MPVEQEHLSIKETIIAKNGIDNFDPLAQTNDTLMHETYTKEQEKDYAKIIWLAGCIIAIIINSLVCGIAVKDMMYFGYNPTAHISMAANIVFTFGAMLGVYEWFIKK